MFGGADVDSVQWNFSGSGLDSESLYEYDVSEHVENGDRGDSKLLQEVAGVSTRGGDVGVLDTGIFEFSNALREDVSMLCNSFKADEPSVALLDELDDVDVSGVTGASNRSVDAWGGGVEVFGGCSSFSENTENDFVFLACLFDGGVGGRKENECISAEKSAIRISGTELLEEDVTVNVGSDKEHIGIGPKYCGPSVTAGCIGGTREAFVNVLINALC